MGWRHPLVDEQAGSWRSAERSGHGTGTAVPLWTGTTILVCHVCLLKAALGQHTADTRSRCSGVRNLWQGRRGCDDERLSNHSAGGAGVSHGRKQTQSGVAPPAAQATSFISPASIFSSDHFRGRAICVCEGASCRQMAGHHVQSRRTRFPLG